MQIHDNFFWTFTFENSFDSCSNKVNKTNKGAGLSWPFLDYSDPLRFEM